MKGAEGFFDVAGMESPGLTCAPAVGEYVAALVKDKLHPEKKEHFISTRKGIPSMALADESRKEKLIRQNPAYANVNCRCEMVTEGEILDAIHRPLGATTTDASRKNKGRHGKVPAGFCLPKTIEILARELQVPVSEILKNEAGSSYLLPDEETEKGTDAGKGGCR